MRAGGDIGSSVVPFRMLRKGVIKYMKKAITPNKAEDKPTVTAAAVAEPAKAAASEPAKPAAAAKAEAAPAAAAVKAEAA